MRASISLGLERAPDFFALCRARGAGCTLVAELHGQLVACISAGVRAGYIGGRPTEVGYIADLKVAPECRGQSLGRMLLERLPSEDVLAHGAPYVITVAKGNRAVDVLLDASIRGWRVERLGDVTSFQLFPLVRLPLRLGGREIRRAQPPDRDELVELLDGFHRQYALAPVFAAGGLEEILKRSAGMAISSYVVAIEDHRIVATLGLWDQGAFKQTRVHRMPFGLRAFAAGARAASRLLPVPALPRLGETLRICHLRHPACRPGCHEALALLARFALNWCRDRGYHLALLTCRDGDPLKGCLRGIPRGTYRYHVAAAVGPLDDDQARGLRSQAVFDDAALA